MWDPYADFQSTTLPNGLTIQVAHWPDRPWEHMGFVIHSGAEQDLQGQDGCAHFVEHLVSENAGMSKKDLWTFLERHGGGAMLGETSYQWSRYRFKAPIERPIFEKAVHQFAAILVQAKLEKFVERERKVIAEEFNRQFPFSFVYDIQTRRRRALYPGSLLNRIIAGSLETINSLTQQDLQAHYDTHYTPANTSIVAVGGLEMGAVVSILENSPFAQNKTGSHTPRPEPQRDFPVLEETYYELEMSQFLTKEAALNNGSYATACKIPGHISPMVMILFEKMLNEILFDEIRERRMWTYGIDSNSHYLGYNWELEIACKALKAQVVEQIVQVIEACIASVADREDLFEKFKRSLHAEKRLYDGTGFQLCIGAMHDLEERRPITSLTQEMLVIEQITMQDIQDLLVWLKPERRFTILMRP